MRRKITIEELQLIAAKKGGYLLSEKFTSTSEKLTWRCGENHVFEATTYSIRNCGRWCPVCGKAKSKKSLGRFFSGSVSSKSENYDALEFLIRSKHSRIQSARNTRNPA